MISNKSTTSVGMVTASRVAISGWLVATNQYEKPADRFVTVQGLAEREVMAERAVWGLPIYAEGPAEVDALAALSRQVRALDSFLVSHGLRPRDWQSSAPTLIRKSATLVRAACTFRIDTGAVWSVAAAHEDRHHLREIGVRLSHHSVPNYHVGNIESLAPELMWEASARARETAERYAESVDTRLVGLNRARQSNLEILGGEGSAARLESRQVIKRLRVVSTLEFRLAT